MEHDDRCEGLDDEKLLSDVSEYGWHVLKVFDTDETPGWDCENRGFVGIDGRVIWAANHLTSESKPWLKISIMEQKPETVTLTFRHTEEEYLAAARLYFWHSKALLVRLSIICVLISICLLLLTRLVNFALSLWFLVILIFLVGMALYHGYLIDLPRRVFRGDPKFREEYNLIYSDAGVTLKTQNINSSINWNFYTSVVEDDKFYLLIYGKNLPSFSIVPKRAFRNNKDEMTFREMLRRHVDPKLKLSAGDRETKDYVPPSLEPPDWR